MALQTKYITLDDYREYFAPKDLVQELGNEENALAFLVRLENRMEAYIDSNFNKNIDKQYPKFTDYQKKHYKLALLEQAIYIVRNGDVSVDSGYDPDKGEVMNVDRVKHLAIAPNCINELRLCGIWNRNIGEASFYANPWWW